MKTMHMSIMLAAVVACVLLVAVGESHAQGGQKGVVEYVRKIPLRDLQGQTQAQMVIVGSRLRFEAPNGESLSLTSAGNSLAPIDELQLPTGRKADEFNEKTDSALQRQIDLLAAKVSELTKRVNELSR